MTVEFARDSLHSRCGEALFEKVITIPNVLITGEAEEMIGDAAARWAELDLVGATHTEMLAADSGCSQCASPEIVEWSMHRHTLLQFVKQI